MLVFVIFMFISLSRGTECALCLFLLMLLFGYKYVLLTTCQFYIFMLYSGRSLSDSKSFCELWVKCESCISRGTLFSLYLVLLNTTLLWNKIISQVIYQTLCL